MNAKTRQKLFDHAANIEQALLAKMDDLSNAADQVQGLLAELHSETDIDEDYIRDELNGIWSSVMSTSYDPNY